MDKAEILKIINEYKYGYSKVTQYLKNSHPDIYKYINDLYPQLADPKYKFVQKIYWLVNNLEDYPKCPICGGPNKREYNSYSVMYKSEECSQKCVKKNPINIEKLKQACLEKYGVEYTGQVKEFIKKREDTCIKKFGSKTCLANKDVRKRIENTNLEKYGVTVPAKNKDILQKMQYTCIERYGVINTSQLKENRQKFKKTCLDRYGVDNPMKAKEVEEKSKKTCLEKYGVEYVGQNPETIDKIKNINLERYGVTCAIHNKEIFKKVKKNKFTNYYNKIVLNNEYVEPMFTSEEYCDDIRKEFKWKCKKCGDIFESIRDFNWYSVGRCLKCYPMVSGYSNVELELIAFIKQILPNETVIENSRSIITPLELDVYIPSKNIAIEFDGLFWHNNQNKDKDYHLNKTLECKRKGITLIHVFEDEWLYKQDIVKSRLKAIFGIYESTVFARKCEIKLVNTADKNAFLKENHIQDIVGSKINIGLYYNDNLVALMAFGNLRKALGGTSKENTYELLRFCNKLNYHIPGAASKLFSYFVKTGKPEKIISYCDRRWSTGNLYKKLGFTLSHTSTPNYWYIIQTRRFHRFNFRKSVLKNKLKKFDETLTETENMTNHGIFKIYDCGNFVFEYIFNK